jgi:hypothetical protein
LVVRSLLLVGGEVARVPVGTHALAVGADVHQGVAGFPGMREVREVWVGDSGSSALASLRKKQKEDVEQRDC